MKDLAADEARSWARGLPAPRRAALSGLGRVEPGRNVVVAGFIGLWLVGGAAAALAPVWWLRLPGYALAGAALHALGICMHEAIHGNLFRRRRLDRWAAFLCGVPVLVSGTAYRISHLAHHRHNRGELDPDEFANHFRSRKVQSAAFWIWGLLGLPIFLCHVPISALRRGTGTERRLVAAEYAAILGLHGAVWIFLAAAARLDLLWHAWVAPMAVTDAIVGLRGWSEHMLTRPGHPLTQTRTVTSNRLVSFLLLNLNYHLEHHLFPGIPWYNLPRVHALLRDEYAAAGAPVYESYWRFLADAVREGIHGLAPRPDTAAGGTPAP